MRVQRALAIAGLAFCLSGCPGEPSPILVTRIELPVGIAPVAAKLHLIQNGHPAFGGPTPPEVARASGNGFDLKLDVGIGPQVEVKLHVWYDVNGNGVEDHGDAAGDLSPSPFVAVDHGGSSSRTNVAPPIRLGLIP